MGWSGGEALTDGTERAPRGVDWLRVHLSVSASHTQSLLPSHSVGYLYPLGLAM